MSARNTQMASVSIVEVGEQSGEHWGGASVEALRDLLRDMQSALRIASGDNYTFDDLDRWEIDPERELSDDDRKEALYECLSWWALDVEVSRTQSLGAEDGPGEIDRVSALLGCGGPTIWLELDLADGVRLRRSWGGDKSDAVSATQAAIDLVSDFFTMAFALELDR